MLDRPGYAAFLVGTADMKCTVEHFDLRPGGRFHYCITPDEGPAMWGLFQFLEIDSPTSLVFIDSFADADGAIIPAPFEWPGLAKSSTRSRSPVSTAEPTFLLARSPQCNRRGTHNFRQPFRFHAPGFSGTFAQLEAFLKERMLFLLKGNPYGFEKIMEILNS